MKNILITGGNGQLGRCIRDAFDNIEDLNCVFVDIEAVDITDKEALQSFFTSNSFDFCINTAAYTQVDQAEKEPERAMAVNADGAAYIAEVCRDHHCVLLHISTDYVFDGKKRGPYTEKDAVAPLGVYGASKLKGEEAIRELLAQHYIIRTSWLYSQYGQNFFRTVCRWGEEGRKMTITTQQKGSPTNANDLAAALLHLIQEGEGRYGTYHFCNAGQTTWYGFARAILELQADFDLSNLEKTDHYPTLAARPANSVLDCSKFVQTFDFEQRHWRDSLKALIENNTNNQNSYG